MRSRSNPRAASRVLLVCGIMDVALAVVFFAVLSRLRPDMRDLIGTAFVVIALLNFVLSYVFKKKAENMTSQQSD